MKDFCENCGRKIEVTIFRGEGFCSDDCRKALGRDVTAGGTTMVLLAPDEKATIEKMREEKT